jgi:hypothetical protein
LGFAILKSPYVEQQGKTADAKPMENSELSKPAPNVAPAPVDHSQAMRESYIKGMNENFLREGIRANVFESGGEMVVVSEALKEKSDRDHFMRITFGPTYGKSLCAIGFRNVKLTSGVVSGEGEGYSLGCSATREEMAGRLQARAEFVNGLQSDFNRDPDLQDIKVAQAGKELIITAPAFKGMSPQQMRAMFGAHSGQQANACSIGFKGVRVKTEPSSGGTFISYNCPKQQL